MQYTAIFHGCKNVNFPMKNYNIFLIFAQNIDVYTCKPQFYYIKVGCKGVFITRTCFRDAITAPDEVLSFKCGGSHFPPYVLLIHMKHSIASSCM